MVKPKRKRRRPVSAATRKKLSKASKGRKVSKATRAKLSKASKGRKVSAKTRAKLSKASKGKHRTAKQRAAINARMKGRKHPHKGHPHTTAGRSHGRRTSTQRPRRERIHPSRFVRAHGRTVSRFKKGRAVRGIRAPFARGRHHVRDWRERGHGRRRRR